MPPLTSFAARIGLLLLCLLTLTVSASQGQADTLTFFADEDGYTGYNHDGGDAYGSGAATRLFVGRMGTNLGSAVHFDVSPVGSGATINSATLFLYQSFGDTSYGLEVHSIYSGNWTENLLQDHDWKTLIQINTLLVSAPSTLDFTYNEFSSNALTQYVQQWVDTPSSNLGLFLALSGNNGLSQNIFKEFAARENGFGQPLLLLNYTPAAPPAIPEPSAVAFLVCSILSGAVFLRRRKQSRKAT